MAQNARKTWAERIRLWKTSGLTAEQFAAGRGFKAGTLRHWSWRLGAERRGWKAGSQSRPPPVVEISLAGPPTRQEPPGTIEATFEVLLDDRLRVRVPPQFDPAALKRLLSALEAH